MLPTARLQPDGGSARGLRRATRQLLIIGIAAVLLFPMARGHSEWLGWLPLWLVGMPAAACWALLGFRLPMPSLPQRATRRRAHPQARRRRMAA
ncbi:MAG TPA: hypothetical protein VNI56_01300, partial [Xanthomonadaceae bacterium]|nr:hypothetical protein [Xanthomonadaceae bacterium]